MITGTQIRQYPDKLTRIERMITDKYGKCTGFIIFDV